MDKELGIAKEDIQNLAPYHGGCLATDRIMVDGCFVGYMYREDPMEDTDSGWRFLAGDEDQEYMENLDHHGFYDVNTVANYDQKIIDLLDSPVGSAFSRDSKESDFVEVPDTLVGED